MAAEVEKKSRIIIHQEVFHCLTLYTNQENPTIQFSEVYGIASPGNACNRDQFQLEAVSVFDCEDLAARAYG